MTGLFNKTPEEVARRQNLEKKKNIKKLVKKKQYAEVLDVGKIYLKKIPHDHDILFIVGSIYYMQKKYSTALSYFERTLDIATYDVDALLLKANSHYFLDQKEQARKCCNMILEVDEKNKGVRELAGKLEA